MSVFGKILGKLGFPTADSSRSGPKAASAPKGGAGAAGAPSHPASGGGSGRPAAGEAGAAGAAAGQVAPGRGPVAAPAASPAVAAAPTAPQAPHAYDVVDVARQLEERAAARAQPLNWRTSIVDLLKLLDIDSSLGARKELATELGCPAELMGDSAKMNVWLHKTVLRKLAENGGKVPQELTD